MTMLASMPSRKKDTPATLPSSDIIRVPRSLSARLSAVGAAMGKRAFVTLPYPVIVRAVLERGLDVLERELGITRKAD
jgi:hypothetical protein